MDGSRRTVSIVVPLYNEAECVEHLVAALNDQCQVDGIDFEYILVDDGSSDGTAEALRELQRAHQRVRYVLLSRNFGHAAALTAGLEAATGDAVIMMDGDLQHPPSVIPTLIDRWLLGYDIVHTVRTDNEGASWLKRSLSNSFYTVFNYFSTCQLRSGMADFRLMSRRAVNALNGLSERQRFIRGLSTWIGFRQDFVEFHAPPRFAGRPSYTLMKSLRLALDGVTSFSFFPLRRAILMGWAITCLSVIYGMSCVLIWLFTDLTVPGWTSLVVCTTFLGGCQLVAAGLIAEYVGRIYEEVKGRPLYITQETGGFESEQRSRLPRVLTARLASPESPTSQASNELPQDVPLLSDRRYVDSLIAELQALKRSA